MNFEGTWSNNGIRNGRNGSTAKASAVEVEPECDICNDTLWVATASGDALSPVKVTPCKCQSKVRDISEHLRTYSELGQLERMTFKSLKPKGRKGRVEPEQFRAALESAKEYAEKPDGWLVIQGPAGSGKTHLAVAIANEVIARGEPVKYVSALSIADLISTRPYSDSEADSGNDSFNVLLDAPLLVIDDLWAHQSPAWIETKVDHLLTHRFNARLNTVIVLARSIDNLPERIALRLDDPDLAKLVKLQPSSTPDGYVDSRIPATMIKRMTFESFNPKGAPRSNEDEQIALGFALQRARDYADNLSGWLYLHGPTGVGKTHLAVAIANTVLKKGRDVTFWRILDLLDCLRRAYVNNNEDSFYQLFRKIRDADLLILDDFNAHSMTDWALEKLYQIMVHRYDRLMPTVITSPYRLWSPDEDELRLHRSPVDHEARLGGIPRNIEDYQLEEEGEKNKNINLSRIDREQLWLSIMSRIRDSFMVTDALMAAPDYRNRRA